LRYFILILSVFLIFAVETPILTVAGMNAYSVNVALLAVIYLAATSPPFGGFVTAVIVGFVADSFTPGGILGMNMEIMAILFLVTRGLAERFQVLRPLPLVGVAMVCSAVEILLVFLFSILFDRNLTQYSSVFVGALPQALSTALAGLLFIPLFRWIDGKIRGRRYTGSLLRL